MFELSAVTSFLVFLLFVLLSVRITYVIVVKHWNYFIERNVRFDRGVPLLGSLYPLMLRKLSMADTLSNIYNKFSNDKFLGMYELGGKPIYMVRDPELIRNISTKDFDYFVNHYFQMDKKSEPLMGRILFSMKDQEWRDMRSVLSPLFTGSKMRLMLSLMNETTDDFTSYIRNEIQEKSPKNGLEYDMMKLLTCLTNDTIGTTAFGIKINSLKDPNNEFYRAGTSIAYAIQSLKAFFVLSFPLMSSWLNIKILSDEQNNFFRNVIRNNVNQRKEKNIVRNDMIHLLLMAKEGRLEEEKDKEIHQDAGFATISEILTAKTSQKLKNWTEDDLVAQCIIFFIAGFTGTATSLSFLCHELAVNQDVQERLYQEICEMRENLNGERVKFEDLQKMTYLDMVVSELFRMWPIATVMDRRVSKQYVLENGDGTKVVLQPDDIVWMPIFAIHRDPKYYPEPFKFDPERFSDVNKKNIHPGTYAPFGLGPRACIASRFALMQMKTTIFHMLLEFKIECSAHTQIPVKLKAGTNQLIPENGFWTQLKLKN